MGGCLSTIRGLVNKSTTGFVSSNEARSTPPVVISLTQKGAQVVVPSPLTCTGIGSACASDAIEFDKTYFEVVIRKPGSFAIGVSKEAEEPKVQFASEIGDDINSWAIKSSMLAAESSVNDVIGVFVDQTGIPTISFSLNGKPLGDMYDIPKPRSNVTIRGRLFPAISVGKGASLEFRFLPETFSHPPPPVYQTVISVRDML